MTVAYQNFKRETAPTKSNPPFCSLLGTRYSCTQIKKKQKVLALELGGDNSTRKHNPSPQVITNKSNTNQ